MLSRTAESCFWIARYTERAEYTARLINVHYHLLFESPNQRDQDAIWRWYLESTGQLALYEELGQSLETMAVMQFLTLDQANPNALVNLISAPEKMREVFKISCRAKYGTTSTGCTWPGEPTCQPASPRLRIVC
ncbi:MAG: alpha-E domain-containing protein [Nitrospira sp.]|nr:alpha-E domain-containing protein [Nitrospira sp.]